MPHQVGQLSLVAGGKVGYKRLPYEKGRPQQSPLPAPASPSGCCQRGSPPHRAKAAPSRSPRRGLRAGFGARTGHAAPPRRLGLLPFLSSSGQVLRMATTIAETGPTFSRLTDKRPTSSWRAAIPAVLIVVALVAGLPYLASRVTPAPPTPSVPPPRGGATRQPPSGTP